MIHHQHKCIFVHITKTAGSSITKALGKHDNENPHRNIFKYREQIEENIFNKYFKFAVVRNPWDRMVSEYHYQKQRKDGRHTNLSFEQYLKQGHPAQTSDQLKWISNINNGDVKLLVDYVIRFEDLNKGIKEVSDKIGYDLELPKINTSVHNEYKTYYTDKTKQIIYKSHRNDIKFFKYEF